MAVTWQLPDGYMAVTCRLGLGGYGSPRYLLGWLTKVSIAMVPRAKRPQGSKSTMHGTATCAA